MIASINVLRHAGLSKIGDCGPCCIGALAGKSVMEVYTDIYGKVKDGMDYDEVLRAICLYELDYDDLIPKDIADDHPRWKQWGRPGWFNAWAWHKNAVAKISTGYVGVAQINMNGSGFKDEYTDHWVLIKGANESNEFKDRTLVISCPTKGDYTIQVKDFLKNYGGYNAIWVKPKTQN